MKIITLCREYGAGGHSIGRKVAAELGIEIYDRDIIDQSAAALGIDPGQLEAEEEGISRRETFLRAITPISYERKDAMYDAECSVILDLAKKGPCVFLGRCADAVLQEAGIDCLRVFLYGDGSGTAAAAEWIRLQLEEAGVAAEVREFRDAAPGGEGTFRNVVGRIAAKGGAEGKKP